MQVEKISIDQLIYDPNNARKHPEKNIMAIKGSLAKFGQQKPVVIDHSNIIIAGNGTVEAAKQLGWTEVDIVRSDLTGFNATAFGLADNRTSELAEWDDEIRDNLLKGLEAVDFDLPSIGFDEVLFQNENTSKIIEGSKEYSSEEFDNFQHKCPKCGFEYNDKN